MACRRRRKGEMKNLRMNKTKGWERNEGEERAGDKSAQRIKKGRSMERIEDTKEMIFCGRLNLHLRCEVTTR
jgi:hypothetical protein